MPLWLRVVFFRSLLCGALWGGLLPFHGLVDFDAIDVELAAYPGRHALTAAMGALEGESLAREELLTGGATQLRLYIGDTEGGSLGGRALAEDVEIEDQSLFQMSGGFSDDRNSPFHAASGPSFPASSHTILTTDSTALASCTRYFSLVGGASAGRGRLAAMFVSSARHVRKIDGSGALVAHREALHRAGADAGSADDAGEAIYAPESLGLVDDDRIGGAVLGAQ